MSISGSSKFEIAQKAYSTDEKKSVTYIYIYIYIVPRGSQFRRLPEKKRWHVSKETILATLHCNAEGTVAVADAMSHFKRFHGMSRASNTILEQISIANIHDQYIEINQRKIYTLYQYCRKILTQTECIPIKVNTNTNSWHAMLEFQLPASDRACTDRLQLCTQNGFVVPLWSWWISLSDGPGSYRSKHLAKQNTLERTNNLWFLRFESHYLRGFRLDVKVRLYLAQCEVLQGEGDGVCSVANLFLGFGGWSFEVYNRKFSI